MTTWLITGASSGLGFSLAEHVLQHGEQVVLTDRTIAPMAELAAQYPATARSFGLDVTDADQRRAAIRFTEEQFGGVDVLVNNAGIDFTGAIEEQREDDIRSQFEVNFFAPLALLRLVLPGMRARNRGTIINISSMDGIASLPANGIYSATKFALEGLTEALWQEIEPIGLRAFLVEPGSLRTGIEQRTEFSGARIDAYEATSGAFRKLMATLTPGMMPGDPARVAEVIYQVATADQPPALGPARQRRPPPGRRETGRPAGRICGRPGTRLEHRLPRQRPGGPVTQTQPPRYVAGHRRFGGPRSRPRRGHGRGRDQLIALRSRTCRRRSSSPVPPPEWGGPRSASSPPKGGMSSPLSAGNRTSKPTPVCAA
jgi:NAD(P)-dependent dehydrogenase (short-subunit alcohol dehydrogenase family)